MFSCMASLSLLIVTPCAAPVCSPKHIHLPPNLDNPAPLDSQGVLVDLDHQAVLQDLLGAWGDGAEIRGHEERSCHHCPQGHLRAGLLIAKAKVSNDELEGREGKDKRGRKGLETGLLATPGDAAACWGEACMENLTHDLPLLEQPTTAGTSHPC